MLIHWLTAQIAQPAPLHESLLFPMHCYPHVRPAGPRDFARPHARCLTSKPISPCSSCIGQEKDIFVYIYELLITHMHKSLRRLDASATFVLCTGAYGLYLSMSSHYACHIPCT